MTENLNSSGSAVGLLASSTVILKNHITCISLNFLSNLILEQRKTKKMQYDINNLCDTNTIFYILGIEYKTPDSKSYEKKRYFCSNNKYEDRAERKSICDNNSSIGIIYIQMTVYNMSAMLLTIRYAFIFY